MKQPLGRLCAAAAATAAVSAPALAAEPAPAEAFSVAEIVVTVRKREETLLQAPMAVSVIGAAQLRDRGGATDTEGLLAGVPGLRFNNTSSPTTSELSIRGSGTARATTADSGVALYRNGVYVGGGLQFGRNFMRIDTFDLERAEVLRGTVGALYGRNAVGGAVNLISARPKFAREGRIDLDYGTTLDRKQVQAVVNEPLNDIVALRFGLDYVDQDKGFFRNKTFGNYFDEQHGLSLRAQARLSHGPLDATLLVENQHLEAANVVFQIDVPPTPPQYPRGYTGEQYAYDWSIPGFVKMDVGGLILNLQYDMGWAKLTSVSALRRRNVQLHADIDGFTTATLLAERARGNPATTTDPNINQGAHDTTNTIFQELHLTGDAGRVSWLAGVEYLKLYSDFYLSQTRTPNAASAIPGAERFHTQNWTSTAVFGSLGYDLTSALNLTAEGRYTSDVKAYTQRGYVLGTTTPTMAATAGGADPENLAYNALLTWRAMRDVTAYAKVGSGYRVGGFNPSIGDPRQPKPVPDTYDNETSTTYEAGAKGDFGSRFYGAVAAYLTHTDEVLVLDNNGCSPSNPVCPVANTNFLTNGGEGRVWGVEVEGAGTFGLMGGDVTVRASASRQEGEFTAGVYKGLEVPQTSDWIASANLDYRRPFGEDLTAFANLNYTAQWGGVQEVIVPIFKLEDRQVLDLRAGLKFGDWEGAVYARNLTDTRYAVVRMTTGRRWGEPRSVGLQLRRSW